MGVGVRVICVWDFVVVVVVGGGGGNGGGGGGGGGSGGGGGGGGGTTFKILDIVLLDTDNAGCDPRPCRSLGDRLTTGPPKLYGGGWGWGLGWEESAQVVLMVAGGIRDPVGG